MWFRSLAPTVLKQTLTSQPPQVPQGQHQEREPQAKPPHLAKMFSMAKEERLPLE